MQRQGPCTCGTPFSSTRDRLRPSCRCKRGFGTKFWKMPGRTCPGLHSSKLWRVVRLSKSAPFAKKEALPGSCCFFEVTWRPGFGLVFVDPFSSHVFAALKQFLNWMTLLRAWPLQVALGRRSQRPLASCCQCPACWTRTSIPSCPL